MTTNNLIEEQLKYKGKSTHPCRMRLCSYNTQNISDFSSSEFTEITDRLEPENINWLQVYGLKNTEAIEKICRKFDIDFLVTQDILNARHLSKVELHDNYNVIIVKILSEQDADDYGMLHIAIVQGKNYVLTFVEQETGFFDDINAAIQKNIMKIRNRKADFLLSVILNSVMTHYMAHVSNIEDKLEDLEEELLDNLGNSHSDMGDMQVYRRKFRVIKKNIQPLKEQINTLFHPDNNLINEENRVFFSDVNDHLRFILQSLESCKEILSSLVDLYLSNNDMRMNNIMKQLTVVSSFFIPLTFCAGIWGMNFKNIPELEWEYGYPAAWGVMIVISVLIFIYFRRKKWF